MRAVRPTSWLLALAALTWAGGCSPLQPRPTAAEMPGTAWKPAHSGTPVEEPGPPPPPVPPPAVPPGPESPAPESPVGPAAAYTLPTPASPLVWGVVGMRGFASGQHTAPNGVDFNPLFSLDLNFNVWLSQQRRVYAFTDTRFWGQKAAPGITNIHQGAFDFSKREFDLDIGAAWNYWGMMEARVFAYSQNNLNRGTDLAHPFGYKDGLGLENRLYVGGSYANLGTPGFDVARANFLSAGFYPTKEMADANGNSFKPGPFLRAYLTYDLFGPSSYLFADVQAIASHSCTPRLLVHDEGVAWRPFSTVPRLEFRAGTAGQQDFEFHELNLTFYGSVRVIY